MNEQVVVVDIGSTCTKVGWAGDDVPTVIFPSTLAETSKYTQYSEPPIEGFEDPRDRIADPNFKYPVYRGTVENWDNYEALWTKVFHELGIESYLPSAKGMSSIDQTQCPSFLIVEPVKTTPQYRGKLAGLLFDKFKIPSISIGNSASLSIFASGRTSGVAIDVGGGCTSSVPVFEGLALSHAAVCSDYGGQDITATLTDLLAMRGIHVETPFARDLKERLAFVPSSANQSYSEEPKYFSLPDGRDVTVESSVFADCTSALFDLDGLDSPSAQSPRLTSRIHNGIGAQAFESIKLCDDSLKRDLASNIILAGGTSMLPGMGDRLNLEINNHLSTLFETRLASSYTAPFEARVLPSTSAREPGYTHQRKVAAWIGGSIIGSASTYRDLKLTRQEWDEKGSDFACLHAKCF